jgi:TIR domain
VPRRDLATPSSFRIFLNYRREDSSGHAGRIWDALRYGLDAEPGFAEQQVFMDIDTIDVGVDFAEVIREAVGSCDVFIAVIGKQWLAAVDSKGHRRLEKPEDFVRLEIEAALERDIRVIPALVQGAEMPSSDEVPQSLTALTRRNAVELSDTRWRFDLGRLLARLKVLEREKVERATATAQETELPPPEGRTRPEATNGDAHGANGPTRLRGAARRRAALDRTGRKGGTDQQREVLRELAQAKGVKLSLIQHLLDRLLQSLKADEELLAACQLGDMAWFGVLGVTPERLVWVHGQEGRSRVRELSYEQIFAARTERYAVVWRKIIISASPETVELKGVTPSDRADALAALINERARG